MTSIDIIQKNGCLMVTVQGNSQCLTPGEFDRAREILPDDLYQRVCEIWPDEVIWAYQEQQRKQQEEWEDMQPKQDMASLKQQAILQTKAWVATELEKPLRYEGKNYSVTMDKQNLLSSQLGLYGLNQQVGIPMELKWNAAGEECEIWLFENLLMLSNAFAAHVQPIVKKQQVAEVEIMLCQTSEQINAVLALLLGV